MKDRSCQNELRKCIQNEFPMVLKVDWMISTKLIGLNFCRRRLWNGCMFNIEKKCIRPLVKSQKKHGLQNEPCPLEWHMKSVNSLSDDKLIFLSNTHSLLLNHSLYISIIEQTTTEAATHKLNNKSLLKAQIIFTTHSITYDRPVLLQIMRNIIRMRMRIIHCCTLNIHVI